MALQALGQGVTLTGKRKHAGDSDDAVTAKRPRDQANPAPSVLLSLSAQPLQTLIDELSPKYDIKTLSVLSSTSISKRVDSVLTHLGRISAWDSSVLPGVVLLYARASSTNKLITIVETVRRRIHEAEQKWYQYNRLYEMEWAAKQQQQQQQQQQSNNGHKRPAHKHKTETMIEDTVMSLDGEGKDSGDEDDDDFEVMASQRTVFERAVHGEEKPRQMAHMSIFLSRIPIPELKARENFAVQSNEDYINYVQKKKSGLVA
ncbi:hypothetical protein NKR19_g1665 [Coniochaeta hoffmannii]|uniref:DNA/RNA-binding protein Alba-like domain-containing protein n=1 Tax=Coniochaeta hoffmannii TaxID=91930 RepID=A0AA38S0C8_9PEZI|nr:hypothetical protein NKR19_g1665 [Coniochaeta hoffmannii]